MKLLLNDLINAKESLTKLAKTDVPVKIAYWLSKDVQKLNSEFVAFEEARGKLFKKYGEKQVNEETKQEQSVIKLENIESFQKEISELLKTEVEVDVHKIKLESLGEIKLSTFDLTALHFIIEE